MMQKQIRVLLFLKLCVSVFFISGMEQCPDVEMQEALQSLHISQFQTAIDEQNIPLVEELMRQAPCLAFVRDQVGLYPFQRALRVGNAGLLALLVQPLKGKINTIMWGNQGNPLSLAIRLHRPDLVNILLENGAYIDARDKITLDTPLSIALEETLKARDEDKKNMNAIVAHLLLSLLSGLNVQRENVRSALIARYKGLMWLHAIAEAFDDPMLILMLLKLGLNPNAPDARGNTPLHLAVAHTNTRVINTLLADPNVEVNVANNRGITPLMMAALNGDIDTIDRLVERGALLNLHDTEGRNVFSYAHQPAVFEHILRVVPPFTPLAITAGLPQVPSFSQVQAQPRFVPPEQFSRIGFNS